MGRGARLHGRIDHLEGAEQGRRHRREAVDLRVVREDPRDGDAGSGDDRGHPGAGPGVELAKQFPERFDRHGQGLPPNRLAMRPSLFSSCSEETRVRFPLARKVYAASVVFSTTMEEGARLVLTTSAGLRAGEKVLVVVDEGTRSVGEAFLAAAKGLGTDPALLEIRARSTDGEDPPEPVGTAMAAADLVLLATTYSMTHTHARRSANRAGARVISMPGIEEGMLRQGGVATDWAEIHEVVRRTARRVRGAREVHLTSAAGADLSFSLEGRDWISEDTGLCTRKGAVTTLPAGELIIAVVEGTASGRLVVDVYFEGRLGEPASAQIADGYASRIVGAQTAIEAMNRGGK